MKRLMVLGNVSHDHARIDLVCLGTHAQCLGIEMHILEV